MTDKLSSMIQDFDGSVCVLGLKKGRNPFHFNKSFVCKHPSHSAKQEGYHVLVCDKHKHTPHNLTPLHKFKDDLPKFSKDINLTMHNQANYAGTASGEVMVSGRAIFMVQTINVQDELFYGNGCGDLVCKKSAIDKMIGLGKASQELPGSITLSGVGDRRLFASMVLIKSVCL